MFEIVLSFAVSFFVLYIVFMWVYVFAQLRLLEKNLTRVRLNFRREMNQIERDAINSLILADEVSRRAAEFEQEDLDQADIDTEYACQILTRSGFQYDPVTGEWTKEVF